MNVRTNVTALNAKTIPVKATKKRTTKTTKKGFNHTYIYAGIFLFLVLCGVVGHNQDAQAIQTVSDKQTAAAQQVIDRKTQLNLEEQHVYDVCNDSRISQEINENNCGYLQDKYNMQFYCKANNTDVNTMCWVEYNGKNWTVKE